MQNSKCKIILLFTFHFLPRATALILHLAFCILHSAPYNNVIILMITSCALTIEGMGTNSILE